ncbi:MAG: hypothetical protein US48_C0041G0003 [Candidatus Levybacteria bacterium GW2011_GWA2_37_36]|nr:MAG: hypothetical protein US43_C0024G0005 [Candidatus Levybacteria bacterium GW2011_GWA1_37_16]KKQ31943.1 MAG: hypothetical protein US48_C0041G0003 [Candidatus Levybacteria bacterium GW2011_GWA2_37_36]KKQ37702.1 MAG: hypothetical protein US55_C0025G0003 [Candidatus Levybacteria bacterium GW2011_GWC2_37_7]KKQ41884.1 MAG: hypothetical protein US59_C0020G0011 [Candidatus Levybacteria bacterium GW2011_GWB1_37_8]OGH49849.1 MAG: hypothetical protein A3H17_00645 [Candidatus Levybacteria bacterium R
MKKILLFLFFIFYFSFFISAAYAADATPTPEDMTSEIRDQLITNIASRVAQLKLVEKRGIIGIVNDITNTQITITDFQNNTRFVDVDELTKFSNPAFKEAFGISDITKDATVGILGLYNKESRRILARFVNIITIPTIVHGGVSAINNEEFSLNIATEEGKQVTVSVENLTKTYSYTQKDDYIRSGFSKIKVNFNILAIGVLDKKDKNRLIATRIIFFPEIPSSPKVNAALEKVQKSK